MNDLIKAAIARYTWNSFARYREVPFERWEAYLATETDLHKGKVASAIAAAYAMENLAEVTPRAVELASLFYAGRVIGPRTPLLTEIEKLMRNAPIEDLILRAVEQDKDIKLVE